ncbi:hypothetical protein ACG04R_16370 [Roseateles sp. BYS78W]|uniref:Uncharacterized protein n=1 Tax=Pelomonas candidula TaxID=3299025 RepID=A0ABW7HEB4_9BURK
MRTQTNSLRSHRTAKPNPRELRRALKGLDDRAVNVLLANVKTRVQLSLVR